MSGISRTTPPPQVHEIPPALGRAVGQPEGANRGTLPPEAATILAHIGDASLAVPTMPRPPARTGLGGAIARARGFIGVERPLEQIIYHDVHLEFFTKAAQDRLNRHLNHFSSLADRDQLECLYENIKLWVMAKPNSMQRMRLSLAMQKILHRYGLTHSTYDGLKIDVASQKTQMLEPTNNAEDVRGEKSETGLAVDFIRKLIANEQVAVAAASLFVPRDFFPNDFQYRQHLQNVWANIFYPLTAEERSLLCSNAPQAETLADFCVVAYEHYKDDILLADIMGFRLLRAINSDQEDFNTIVATLLDDPAHHSVAIWLIGTGLVFGEAHDFQAVKTAHDAYPNKRAHWYEFERVRVTFKLYEEAPRFRDQSPDDSTGRIFSNLTALMTPTTSYDDLYVAIRALAVEAQKVPLELREHIAETLLEQYKIRYDAKSTEKTRKAMEETLNDFLQLLPESELRDEVARFCRDAGDPTSLFITDFLLQRLAETHLRNEINLRTPNTYIALNELIRRKADISKIDFDDLDLQRLVMIASREQGTFASTALTAEQLLACARQRVSLKGAILNHIRLAGKDLTGLAFKEAALTKDVIAGALIKETWLDDVSCASLQYADGMRDFRGFLFNRVPQALSGATVDAAGLISLIHALGLSPNRKDVLANMTIAGGTLSAITTSQRYTLTSCRFEDVDFDSAVDQAIIIPDCTLINCTIRGSIRGIAGTDAPYRPNEKYKSAKFISIDEKTYLKSYEAGTRDFYAAKPILGADWRTVPLAQADVSMHLLQALLASKRTDLRGIHLIHCDFDDATLDLRGRDWTGATSSSRFGFGKSTIDAAFFRAFETNAHVAPGQDDRFENCVFDDPAFANISLDNIFFTPDALKSLLTRHNKKHFRTLRIHCTNTPTVIDLRGCTADYLYLLGDPNIVITIIADRGLVESLRQHRRTDFRNFIFADPALEGIALAGLTIDLGVLDSLYKLGRRGTKHPLLDEIVDLYKGPHANKIDRLAKIFRKHPVVQDLENFDEILDYLIENVKVTTIENVRERDLNGIMRSVAKTVIREREDVLAAMQIYRPAGSTPRTASNRPRRR